jgi:hypothetical protein
MADRGRGRGQRGQRGQRGHRGSGRGCGCGGAPGNSNGSSTGMSFEFQNTGACTRSSCPFPHNSGQQASRRENTTVKVPVTPEQPQAIKSYSAWKRHLSSDPNDGRTMQQLWGGTVNILEENDHNLTQQLPRDLDTEDKDHNGRHQIKAIVNRQVRYGYATQLIRNCQQFLLTMTHPSMLDGLAVDTYVGSLYNLMSGSNGTRAMPFFQHLCECLVAARTDNDPSMSTDILRSTLVAISVALCELLKRESRARFNEDLEALTDTMESAATMFATDKPTITSIIVVNHVRCIRDMVARANGLLSMETVGTNGHLAGSSYPRDLVVPSDRHDNDKLDMTEIVIFPTRNEIMSDIKEFLPFTDPGQPHFLNDPIQRHIDTHFRLFRHDIFGELKGTLASIMQAFGRDQASVNNPHLRLGDTRTYRYPGAFVGKVLFARALELHVSFSPPQEIANKSFATQRKWWEESKRLKSGCLLSFIWIQNEVVQHLFLTLVNRGAKDEEGEDSMQDNGLVTITACLVTQDKAALELLMRASAGRFQGVLLEFPRFMPATFVLILENLQSMQRTGGMPFHQWIVPAWKKQAAVDAE